MSKIQDALRKMQEAAPAAGNGRSRPQPIGQLVDELDETGIRFMPADGGLITIDRNLLCESGYLAPADQVRSRTRC